MRWKEVTCAHMHMFTCTCQYPALNLLDTFSPLLSSEAFLALLDCLFTKLGLKHPTLRHYGGGGVILRKPMTHPTVSAKIWCRYKNACCFLCKQDVPLNACDRAFLANVS
jgi:hypothetical protein